MRSLSEGPSLLELPHFESSESTIDDLSYSEFKNLSISYQHIILSQLKEEHLSVQPKIVILLKSDVQAYAAMFACLDLGFCYIPLNIDNSLDLNLSVIELVQPDVIISNLERLGEYNYSSVIDPSMANINHHEKVNLRSFYSFTLDSLAYIIFTSGSTGTPKGVQVTRRNLFCYLDWCSETLPFSSNQKVLQTASIAFDLSVLSIFPPIIANSSLVSLQAHQNRIAPWEVISSEKINVIVSVPSFLSLIISSGNLDQKIFDIRSTFIFCGEALTDNLASNIFSILTESVVWNLYGPTEVTVSCSAIKLTSDCYRHYSDSCYLSIGKPNSNHTFEIKSFIDKSGDTTSSLLVSGCQVTIGYLNAPDLTSKLFNHSEDGIRTYDTGDEVYKRSDGYYFFKRRIDRQIKISGYRIELEEIESKVLKAGADEAIAISKNTYIKVIYFSKNNLPPHELLQKLTDKFPSYYRLKFIQSDSLLKRTLNGKINVKFYDSVT